MLQLLLALTQPRYAPPGAAGLVAAALAFAPYTEPLQCLGPSYITSMWCTDRRRGVAVGDPDLSAHSFSGGWVEHRQRLRALLRGNSSDGSGAVLPLDAVDWAVVNPLWAPPEMLRELPPLAIHVRRAAGAGLAGWWAFGQRRAAVPCTLPRLSCPSPGPPYPALPPPITPLPPAPPSRRSDLSSLPSCHHLLPPAAPPLLQVGTSDKYLAEDLEFAQRAARAGARCVQVELFEGALAGTAGRAWAGGGGVGGRGGSR